MPKSLFHKTSRGESLRRGTALLTLPDPFPCSQAQNELLTTEAGLQVLDIAVLRSGVFFSPREKRFKNIFQHFFFPPSLFDVSKAVTPAQCQLRDPRTEGSQPATLR